MPCNEPSLKVNQKLCLFLYRKKEIESLSKQINTHVLLSLMMSKVTLIKRHMKIFAWILIIHTLSETFRSILLMVLERKRVSNLITFLVSMINLEKIVQSGI